jgi:hypothetical protein
VMASTSLMSGLCSVPQAVTQRTMGRANRHTVGSPLSVLLPVLQPGSKPMEWVDA